MKRFWMVIGLAVMLVSLNSCGLPVAVARSVGRLVQATDGLVGPALMAL